MDIEFIQLEHRENCLKLMQICGVELQQAYELYTEAGYNFEGAINRKFNPPPQQNDFPPQQAFDPLPQPGNFGPPGFDDGGYYQDQDIEYEQYKQFKRTGKSFDRKFPVRAHQTLFQSIIPKFFKRGDDNPFKQKLEKYLDRPSNIKTDGGNLSETFNWCWKQKFPIAVILLDFSNNALPFVKKFFSEDQLIEKVISEQFKAYGLDTRDYDLEPELKTFFNFQRDANCIVVCRVNHLDEINVVTKINLSDHIDDIKKKIKQAKSECIQNQLDESHIARQFTEQLRGNFNYQRPKTIKESIKMREDKKLRKQQEEEFFKACQPKGKEEQKPTSKKEEIMPQKHEFKPQKQQIKPEIRPQKPQMKPEVKPEVKPEPVPALSEQKVKKGRTERWQKLRKYADGIMFKVRMPSGSNMMVSVDREEYVQYLFNYIECQPQDLGFADELSRKFDICIGFGGSQTLRGKEGKKIKEVFEDSEVLIVREL